MACARRNTTAISNLCHNCLRIDNTSRKCLSFFCLAILALSMLGNYCAGLVIPRRNLRIPTVDRFSFIEPKVLNNILYKNVLWANPRNIDIGFGTSNVFANELLRHNLLTASDECELSKHHKLSVHIKAQRKILAKELGRQVSDLEIADTLEIPEDQVKTLEERGEAAKSLLVKANMRLVFHIARYYKFRGVAYPDLVQEGTFGLIKAVDKYDPDRGFRFSTYASWWIKQSVSRSIAEKSRIIRLPVHIHDMMVSITKAEKLFRSQYGRKPNSHELSERLALPVQKVELLVKCSREVKSIDDEIYKSRGLAQNNEVHVKDRIASEQAEPSMLNERNSLRSELRNAMQHLSEREAQIVEMRFGLTSGAPMTLEEIGKQFNVTRERIRQIEARAMAKLRNPVKTNELKEIFQDHSLAQNSNGARFDSLESAIQISFPPTPSTVDNTLTYAL